MTLLVIIISILVFVVTILLIPIRIKVDSNYHIYLVEWRHLFSAKLLWRNEEPIIFLKSFFWKKEIPLLNIQTTSKKKLPKEKKTSKRKKTTFDFRKKIKPLLKSFQVRQFFINIDTDNYIWNAYLFPVFYFLKNKERQLHINFQGDVEVLLEIQNRPIRILWILIF